MNIKDTIQTSTGSITLSRSGIIYVYANPEFQGKINVLKAKEIACAIKRLSNSEIYPILGFMSDQEITDEARKYLLENLSVRSVALIASSFVARMMANLIINFRKPPVPIRLFDAEEKALEWVQQIQLSEELLAT